MEIKLNLNIDSVARVTNTQPRASRLVDRTAAVPGFESSRALEARLQELPDVRPEKVDHGRRSVGDPAYPPPETLRRLAALLAMEMGKAAAGSLD